MDLGTQKSVLAAKDALKFLAEKGSGLNRWSYVSDRGNRSDENGACWFGLQSKDGNKELLPPGGTLAAGFTGDLVKYQGACVYGEKSRDFLKFLVSQESPWRSTIVPHMVSKDPDEIFSDRGFIFQGLDEINYLLLMNFLIATRMPAEFPSKYDTFVSLRSEMPLISAYLTSQSFVKTQGDKTFELFYQSGHEPFSSHKMENLFDRLCSGQENGIRKSFYGGRVLYPQGIKEGMNSYFSSPFWSEAKNPPLFAGLPDKMSLDTLKKYPGAFTVDLPSGISEKVSFIEDYWKKKTPRIEKPLKKMRSSKISTEELDFMS